MAFFHPLARRLLGRAAAVALLLAGLLLPADEPHAATLGGALALRLEAAAGLAADEQSEADLVVLSRFYQEREMTPLWVTPAGVTERGAALVAVVQAIGAGRARA